MAHKRKLTDEQIVAVVKQLKADRSAVEIAREAGITCTRLLLEGDVRGMEPSEPCGSGTWKTRTAA